MVLPTLLTVGNLVPQKWQNKKEQDQLKKQIPIDYIINFLSDRIPSTRGGKPKIKTKTFGEKVIVLRSATGSGKSTSLVYALYKNFMERMRKNVVSLQPRVLSAVSIPSEILQFADDMEMDKNIGYSTQKFKRPPKEKGILFCTYGIVTQQILSAETPEDFMKLYSIILVDEVHTASIEEYSLLFLLKKLLINHFDDPECPFIILTSATFDEKLFMEYFEVPNINFIEVQGFAYPKTICYPKYDIIDFQQFALKTALSIHIDNICDIYGKEKSIYRDIIIFVPTESIGQKLMVEFHKYNSILFNQEFEKIEKWKETELCRDMESLYKKTRKIEGGDEKISNAARFYILPILLSKKTYEAGGLEYQNLFSKIETISLPIWNLKPKEELDITTKPDKFVIPSRRILCATNIAETGVSIETLRYCIDCGLEFSVSFVPDYAAQLMIQKACTQGMVTQRKGRVGRKSPGVWFPCFTEDTFNKMQKDAYADVITSDPIDNILNILINETETKIVVETSKTIISSKTKRIENNLFLRNSISDSRWLKLESKKNFNMSNLNFIEMPSAPSLQYAVEKLHVLGMIDDSYNITIFGYLANLIRFIPIEAKRMIFGGFASGASIMDLITVAAFIQTSKRSIFGKKYKTPNLLGKPNFDFIYRVLIGDELIGCILLWNDFNDWVNTKINKLFRSTHGVFKNNSGLITVEAVKEWCEEREILYDGWGIMIANRDVLLESLITIGLNVHYNTANELSGKYNLKQLLMQNLDEGLEEIRKIKEAIYSGYYLNICQWNENKRIYVLLSRNIPIQTKSEVLPYLNPIFAKQTKPRFITLTNYTMGVSQLSAIFEFSSSGYISVLDNYVNVDTHMNY